MNDLEQKFAAEIETRFAKVNAAKDAVYDAIKNLKKEAETAQLPFRINLCGVAFEFQPTTNVTNPGLEGTAFEELIESVTDVYPSGYNGWSNSYQDW